MKNGFSAMDVILSMANYKFMTSEFVKSESYYIIILTDRNEHAIDPTACLDANGYAPICWWDQCKILPFESSYNHTRLIIQMIRLSIWILWTLVISLSRTVFVKNFILWGAWMWDVERTKTNLIFVGYISAACIHATHTAIEINVFPSRANTVWDEGKPGTLEICFTFERRNLCMGSPPLLFTSKNVIEMNKMIFLNDSSKSMGLEYKQWFKNMGLEMMIQKHGPHDLKWLYKSVGLEYKQWFKNMGLEMMIQKHGPHDLKWLYKSVGLEYKRWFKSMGLVIQNDDSREWVSNINDDSRFEMMIPDLVNLNDDSTAWWVSWFKMMIQEHGSHNSSCHVSAVPINLKCYVGLFEKDRNINKSSPWGRNMMATQTTPPHKRLHEYVTVRPCLEKKLIVRSQKEGTKKESNLIK